jgi:NodT family efflux transporter outer membrane factor (OMF) lipoprotein
MALKKVIEIYTIVSIILTLAACGPSKSFKTPENATLGLYRDAQTSDTTTIANIPYHDIFKDAMLIHLIEEGIANNYDLVAAVANIKQAEANVHVARMAFFPKLNAGGQATMQKLSDGQSRGLAYNDRIYQVSATGSWEVNIWGQLSSAKRVELALLLQSYAYRRAVQTQLVSEIATNYYNLMAFDKQLAITLETVKNRRQDVATNKALKAANRLTEAAVAQSEANLYAAEVSIPDLQFNIRQIENVLSVLVSRPPGPIERDSLDNQQFEFDLRLGVPAQLLSNRPDVQQAEFELRANFEQIKFAHSYFYPALTITAQSGWQSAATNTLFNPSTTFWNLVGGLVQPIFNQGLNQQRLTVAKAQYEGNLANFKKTLLLAGQEVSDALYSYQMALEKRETRQQQLAALKKAVAYNKELLQNGYGNTSYIDVLTAEQAYLAAQLSKIGDQLQELTAVVDLYVGVGGGWK